MFKPIITAKYIFLRDAILDLGAGNYGPTTTTFCNIIQIYKILLNTEFHHDTIYKCEREFLKGTLYGD